MLFGQLFKTFNKITSWMPCSLVTVCSMETVHILVTEALHNISKHFTFSPSLTCLQPLTLLIIRMCSPLLANWKTGSYTLTFFLIIHTGSRLPYNREVSLHHLKALPLKGQYLVHFWSSRKPHDWTQWSGLMDSPTIATPMTHTRTVLIYLSFLLSTSQVSQKIADCLSDHSYWIKIHHVKLNLDKKCQKSSIFWASFTTVTENWWYFRHFNSL